MPHLTLADIASRTPVAEKRKAKKWTQKAKAAAEKPAQEKVETTQKRKPMYSHPNSHRMNDG